MAHVRRQIQENRPPRTIRELEVGVAGGLSKAHQGFPLAYFRCDYGQTGSKLTTRSTARLKLSEFVQADRRSQLV